MRAMAITEFGGADKLRLMELPLPEPGPGEIRIHIKAAGVNPVDWKIREGLLKGRLPHAFPLIPGWDAAGIVDKVGPGASRFAVGDEVYAYCRKPVIQGGTYAEYVTVPHASGALKPKNMSFEEAATVPLAALTAWQCLFDAAKLQQNETVLVHAAAGGVGSFAVQLARDRGARILGTAGLRNHPYLAALGCDVPIDYASGDIWATVRQKAPGHVDVVLDCVGGGALKASVDVLAKGGRMVSIVDPGEVEKLKQKGVEAHYVFVSPNQDELAMLTRMIEDGRLRTHISERFPLEEAAEAQALSKGGHTQGKIVLTI
jgi:NADPH2:quinone reductase